MMCCVANFWSWRVLVSCGWNIFAKVLSHLVGLSGQVLGALCGSPFCPHSSERTCQGFVALGRSDTSHKEGTGDSQRETASSEFARVTHPDLRIQGNPLCQPVLATFVVTDQPAYSVESSCSSGQTAFATFVVADQLNQSSPL